jgi:anti-sigma28 factor (negative regulator of flagellin synthesis)
MKINEYNAVNISTRQTDRPSETQKSDAGSSRGLQLVKPAGDRIDVGNQANLMSQAQSAGSADRADVVERLRGLVQSGHYQVDPYALSQSMITGALNGY